MQGKIRPIRWRPAMLLAMALVTAVGLLGSFSSPAAAAPETFLDPGGDVGVDGKSDLNGVDVEYLAGSLEIAWYYDNVLENTGNANDKGACVDLDTNGDQLVDYSVCYDPDDGVSYLFTCDNSTLEGCSQSGSSATPLPVGTCTESLVAELPVSDEYDEPSNQDTKIDCSLDFSLFDGETPAILNVCTVQSDAVESMGTSSHKDCVLRPVGLGELTLQKVVADGDASPADFTLVATDPISGAVVISEPGPTTSTVDVLAGSYDLSETSSLIDDGLYELVALEL